MIDTGCRWPDPYLVQPVGDPAPWAALAGGRGTAAPTVSWFLPPAAPPPVKMLGC